MQYLCPIYFMETRIEPNGWGIKSGSGWGGCD
jgi:hypothetical protein